MSADEYHTILTLNAARDNEGFTGFEIHDYFPDILPLQNQPSAMERVISRTKLKKCGLDYYFSQTKEKRTRKKTKREDSYTIILHQIVLQG